MEEHSSCHTRIEEASEEIPSISIDHNHIHLFLTNEFFQSEGEVSFVQHAHFDRGIGIVMRMILPDGFELHLVPFRCAH